ncbi:MAG: class I SAM-dependent methyltransferase [Phycisphaerales bacterium JB059]
MLLYAKDSDYDDLEPCVNTKTWQERFLIENLKRHVTADARVLEVGANDNTLILDAIGKGEHWIADPYDAGGAGVLAEPPELDPRIIISRCNIGASSNALPSDYFDVIFSSSVLEHIGQRETNFDTRYTPNPPEEQERPRRAFCRECMRLLKPGGVTIHTIDHGVRNISFDANFREVGFEPLNPEDTLTHREMLDDPEALRQTMSWHDKTQPLHPGVARLNTVLAVGYRKPIGAPRLWAELPAHTIDPTLKERPPMAPTPWRTEK